MGTWVHFSRSLPSNSWWQTMAGWQVLSRPSAAEGGGRRPAFTGLATRPYSATEVDGWQHKLSRVSQNRPQYTVRERFCYLIGCRLAVAPSSTSHSARQGSTCPSRPRSSSSIASTTACASAAEYAPGPRFRQRRRRFVAAGPRAMCCLTATPEGTIVRKASLPHSGRHSRHCL
jgi:hypothetical protein